MILFLEQAAGIYYLLMGISVLVQGKKIWYPLINSLENLELVPIFGIYSLAVGLPFVYFHNIWEMNLSVLTTIFGWGAFIKGILYLLIPQILFKVIPASQRGREIYFKIGGIFALIIGALMIYHGFWA